MTPEFIHLHVHSAFSLLDGCTKVEKLVKWAAEQKMPAIAVTDTGNVFGAMALAHAGCDNGVQPILGCQLLVKSPEKEAVLGAEPTFDSVVVLVQSEEGYHSLLKWFTAYYMSPEKQVQPHLTFEELCSHTNGLILLTGGAKGILGRPVAKGDIEFARVLVQKLHKAFPNRLYMEIMRHGEELEALTEPGFLQLAYDENIPLVATNECFFTNPDMYEAHDALMCIADKTYVAESDRRKINNQYYLKTADEMKELFKDLPEALENSVQIAKRCHFIKKKKKPAFPIFDCGDMTADEMLTAHAREGLSKRMVGRSDEEKKQYQDRLEYELGVIKQMGFPSYFLIVADFIQWSKAHGVPVGPGRGSGAGSVVAWALTITDIDPLRFNLLFERFLNPERVSMPDFDVDFCQEKREKTIEYVQNKYGFDHVAQIITFGKLQAKAVIRDVARVLQIPYSVADRLSKLVPGGMNPATKHPYTLQEAIDIEPEFKKIAEEEEGVSLLLEMALKLEGLNRNTSTHAAGVVIGDKPLDQIVPIYKDPSSDMPVTQYDMKYVEKASLIKFDFLGLKTLTVIAKALELIKKRGIVLDMDNLPLDDKPTFDLLKAADTTGVFQLESQGMKQILRDMQPDVIEDIVALVSLYRPGPMDSIPSYIARKKGLEEPDYMHPMLENILKETYGIMIYQEQVMQISQVMAGYTLGGADLLRRAMGKKKVEEMAKQRVIFIEGAKAKGVDQKVAETVFDKMAKFASYGFNKSHAAAYAYIAYQTAYLKAHFPVEFMAATMTLDKTNTEKLDFFKNDLAQRGILLLPPDINLSGVNFTVENGAVRYALSAIRNVGEAAMQVVVEEREKNGPFKSIQDFLTRVDVSALNKRYVENLVRSGAFDSIHKNRAQLFASVEKMLGYAAAATEQRKSSQISLFGEGAENTPFKMDALPDWSLLEKLTHEQDAIGFYLSAHPLDSYALAFERLRITASDDVNDIVKHLGPKQLKLAGIVSVVRERISQKGNKYAFVSASDKAGAFEFICFSDLLIAHRDKLKSGQPLLLTIMADKRDGEDEVRMSLQNVEYLSDVMAHTSTTLIVTMDKVDKINEVQKILKTHAGGQGKVFVSLKLEEMDVEISIPGHYTFRQEVLDALEQLSGVVQVKQV